MFLDKIEQMKHKIGYNQKITKSNNTYVSINNHDQDVFMKNILAINSYMQELSLTNDPDVQKFMKWWVGIDKKYPYSKKLGRYNSPQSMMAGLVNNIMYGNQRDLSLEQLPFYEDIINIAVEVIEELENVKQYHLQPNHKLTQIQFGLGF